MSPPSARRERSAYLAFGTISTILLLYWGLASGQPGWNYGGTWSVLGNALLLAFLAVLVLGFLVPAMRYVRDSTRNRPRALLGFVGLASGAVLVWLAATGSLELAPLNAVEEFTVVPILSPFGLWPSAIFLSGPVGVQGYLSPAILALSVVSSLLWASVMLRVWNARERVRACSPAGTAPRTPLVWSALGAWLPATAVGGACCSAPPLAFAALGAVLPSASADWTFVELGGVAVPGMLYLLYFGVLLVLERRMKFLAIGSRP